MNNHADTSTRRKLASWLVAQTIIIIFAVILTFILVELVVKFVFTRDSTSEDMMQIIYRSSGTIIPMTFFLGAINYNLSKIIYTYIGTIADALKKLAGGDFSVELDVKKAGPFKVVYQNLNLTSKELNKVQLLRTDFTNHYSHEFKTPLTSIKGFAELLLEGDLSPELEKEYLEIIIEEAQRLSEMTQTTILLSQVNSQEIIENKASYSLDEQLRKCLILFLKEAAQKEIQIESQLETCQFYGDQNLMKHVWLNLLNNALKFTPKQGKITISNTVTPKEILIKIQNTGTGISEKEIQNIFEPYFQSQDRESNKGLGLGLAIAQRIVTLSGGKITVESQYEQDTTFTVHLPL